ncbi:MAG: hypothetical protein ACJAXR_000621 [Halopseudomonas sp.]|jgi:hypothetical protein
MTGAADCGATPQLCLTLKPERGVRVRASLHAQVEPTTKDTDKTDNN